MLWKTLHHIVMKHTAPQSREEALMQRSQGGSGRERDNTICPPQETSGAPQKATVFSGDCCKLRKGELPLQALPVATQIAACLHTEEN